MAKVYAGKAPWSEGYKRVTKRTQKQAGVEWSLSSGWRKKSPDEWDTYPKSTPMRTITLYNGRKVQVPVSDYTDFIGHTKSETSDPDSEIGKYIYKALVEQEDKLQSVRGVGHIDEIAYSPTYQLMQVFFKTDGAVVVYFRVPKELYSELAYLAKSGGTFVDQNGITRHVLGKVFWDIVRIRGTKHGSRYRFEYMQTGERRGSRIDVRARENAKQVSDLQEAVKQLDILATNFFSGKKLDEYRKLQTYEEKEAFLSRAGVL